MSSFRHQSKGDNKLFVTLQNRNFVSVCLRAKNQVYRVTWQLLTRLLKTYPKTTIKSTQTNYRKRPIKSLYFKYNIKSKNNLMTCN